MLDAWTIARLVQQVVCPFRAEQLANLAVAEAHAGIDDAVAFGRCRLAIGQMLLDRRLIGQRSPCILAAGDEDARALQSRMNLGAENTDRVLQRTRGLKLGFVDGVEEEPRFLGRGEPAGELRGGAHLERLVEIGIDLPDANEEGVPAALLNFPGAGLRLERLACTRVGDVQDAKVILDLVPVLGPARPQHEKVPLSRARRDRREPPDELDDLLGHGCDPAFAG